MNTPTLTDDEQDLIERLEECKRLVADRAYLLSAHVKHSAFRANAVEIMRKLQDMAWPNASNSQQARPRLNH